jgi:hypothetical protein
MMETDNIGRSNRIRECGLSTRTKKSLRQYFPYIQMVNYNCILLGIPVALHCSKSAELTVEPACILLAVKHRRNSSLNISPFYGAASNPPNWTLPFTIRVRSSVAIAIPRRIYPVAVPMVYHLDNYPNCTQYSYSNGMEEQ